MLRGQSRSELVRGNERDAARIRSVCPGAAAASAAATRWVRSPGTPGLTTQKPNGGRDYQADRDQLPLHETSSKIPRPGGTCQIKLPTWYTTSAATYAKTVMYTKVNRGQRQVLVSRRITARVETH